MEIVTEDRIRNDLRNIDSSNVREYRVARGTVVTPSAKTYLSDLKISFVVDDELPNKGDVRLVIEADKTEKVIEADKTEKIVEASIEKIVEMGTAPSNLPPPKKYTYESVDGGVFDKKPEHMTQLYGEKLVYKDHPIIAFRGAIDDFESKILETQIYLLKLGMKKVVDDLEEILGYVKNILKCEVLNQHLEDMNLLGLNSDEIRERSHFPKKYFGINHFATSYEHGEVVVKLNSLRSESRKLEILAYKTFKRDYEPPSREDIIKSLNRLSSLFYVMMFKALKGEYV